MNASVDVTWTFSVALELVLVASTFSLRPPVSYSASWIETVSVDDGGGESKSSAFDRGGATRASTDGERGSHAQMSFSRRS
jgi:hypothetical protein